MSISQKFQQRLKEKVLEQDFATSVELVERLKISYAIYSKAINYGIVPKPIILVRIADFFNTSIEYLLGRTDDDYFQKSKLSLGFKDRLEGLREASNMTYYQLSIALNFSKNYFSDWKKRNYIPSLETLVEISDYFEVSLDYLLGRTDDLK